MIFLKWISMIPIQKRIYFDFIILFILFKSANLDISLSFFSIFSDDFFLGIKALSGRISDIRF